MSRVYGKLGVRDLQHHHSGRDISLAGQESPSIDTGGDTMIEAGMVFSVEPELSVPGLAPFRHSDAVVVTETGVTRLTSYPRDLESMTILL